MRDLLFWVCGFIAGHYVTRIIKTVQEFLKIRKELKLSQRMEIIDLKDSPYKNSIAQNGFDSVSLGKVFLKTDNLFVQETPHCCKHGAMNRMDSSGLWRCIMCNVGAFQLPKKKKKT